MMHSVNWPNDTCVGWMIKTMVPVRRGQEYLLSVDQARTGPVETSCLWEEVAAEAYWQFSRVGIMPFSLFIYYFVFRLLSCLFVYVVSLCLLLCLIVYDVCFVPSWWLIVAFITAYLHSHSQY